MKIGLRWLMIVFALAGAGCSTTPSRTSGGFLGEATRNPSRHIGQLVAAFGSVLSVRESGGTTVFRAATSNYAYVFEVSYPGDVPALEKGRDVSFLGTVAGTIDESEVVSGRILRLEGIAVVPFAKQAVYRPDQQELARSWLDGKLDVAQGGGWLAAPRTAAAEAPPASPAATPVRDEGDAAALKALLKRWSASPGEVKAKLRDTLERWNGLTDEEKALFLEWNSLSDEDKALFRQLVTDSGPR